MSDTDPAQPSAVPSGEVEAASGSVSSAPIPEESTPTPTDSPDPQPEVEAEPLLESEAADYRSPYRGPVGY